MGSKTQNIIDNLTPIVEEYVSVSYKVKELELSKLNPDNYKTVHSQLIPLWDNQAELENKILDVLKNAFK